VPRRRWPLPPGHGLNSTRTLPLIVSSNHYISPSQPHRLISDHVHRRHVRIRVRGSHGEFQPRLSIIINLNRAAGAPGPGLGTVTTQSESLSPRGRAGERRTPSPPAGGPGASGSLWLRLSPGRCGSPCIQDRGLKPASRAAYRGQPTVLTRSVGVRCGPGPPGRVGRPGRRVRAAADSETDSDSQHTGELDWPQERQTTITAATPASRSGNLKVGLPGGSPGGSRVAGPGPQVLTQSFLHSEASSFAGVSPSSRSRCGRPCAAGHHHDTL
jgi:hypothetical protein